MEVFGKVCIYYFVHRLFDVSLDDSIEILDYIGTYILTVVTPGSVCLPSSHSQYPAVHVLFMYPYIATSLAVSYHLDSLCHFFFADSRNSDLPENH